MRLSDLQLKEVVDISFGKKVGNIIDITIDLSSGKISNLIIEPSRNMRKFLSTKEDREIMYNQIIKIGDDIILIDTKH
ncbi:MAG: YlmC/YmxH family sporulation protein [Bacilli bacterium]